MEVHMYGIDVLVEEHENILRFNKVVRKMCISVMNGSEPVLADFEKVIAFGRNYADKQHHGKEEKILFAAMLEELGALADKLIRHGMYVEHDLGRLHMMQLDEAVRAYREQPDDEIKLNIIMNASGYTALLERHIARENDAVYTFAERSLKDTTRKRVDEETKAFEEETAKEHVQEKYLDLLSELEKKYL
jgi:hemerythrin-like domain-containing protein